MDEIEIRLFDYHTQEDTLIRQFAFDEKIIDLRWRAKGDRLVVLLASGMALLELNGELTPIANSKIPRLLDWTTNEAGEIFYSAATFKTKIHALAMPNEDSGPLPEHAKGHKIDDSSKSEYSAIYADSGQTLYYLSNRESQHFRIWQKQNGQSRLVLDNAVLRLFAWSGSSNQLLALSKDEALLLIQPETKDVKRFELGNLTSIRGAVITDDGKLYFTARADNHYGLYRLDHATGVIQPLDVADAYYIQWQPEDKALYFNKYKQNGLWRQTLGKVTPELVLADFNGHNFDNWQLLNKDLFYIRNAEDSRGLFSLNLSTGAERELIHNKEIYRFAVSPDQGTALISEKKELTGDLYRTRLQ